MRKLFCIIALCASAFGHAQPRPAAKDLTCNNWLSLPGGSAYMQAGDLDISGTKITVEATMNRTTPYSGGNLWAGDVVSKHDNPNDCNYLLRPNSAQITTTNGHFIAASTCDIQLNKTYHVALVYDGSILKFYRNGFLMSSVPASGNLFQNNWPLRIGWYASMVHNTQFVGYINEVRIWNVVRTQAEIQSTMNGSLPNPTTQPGLLAYYTFDDLVNKQGNTAWNGTLGGAAMINQTNPTCNTFVADTCGIPPPGPKRDFTYTQDVCNPTSVRFDAIGNLGNLQGPYWSFGDGNTLNNGNLHPVNNYSAFNNYQVRFSATDGTSRDTVRKTIPVNVTQDNALVITPDTVMCKASPKQLRTQPSLNFCWMPTTYLSDPLSPNPIASPPSDITYYFTAQVTGTNLVVNGDFSAGAIAFTSDFTYTPPPNLSAGQYYVGTNPQAWNASMSNCRDHTTGSGNMLMVNAAGSVSTTIWKQAVALPTNGNYAFSVWVQTLNATNPAQLQFAINDIEAGVINAPAQTCGWTQYYITWNSGGTSPVTLSLINKNSQTTGNDFALDDISFAPVFVKRDSVRITVEDPVVDATDVQPICEGKTVQLNATGTANYSWTPAGSLSNPSIANPVATPLVTTKYIVTGSTANGCTAKDSVTVVVNAKPQVTTTNDTSICKGSQLQLFATGGVTYEWTPAATLNDASIATPVASPVGPTKYYVKVTGANQCDNTDSVKIDIIPDPAFRVTGNKPICRGESVTLVASGGDTYSWSPVADLSAPNAATTLASPTTTTQYSVLVSESTCNNDSLIVVNVVVNDLPTVNAQKSNDIDCTSPATNLMVSGNAASFLWSPATGLDDPRKQNPISTANTTTTYKVTGTNQFGCSSSDTVTVKVTTTGRPVFEVPNAFTPNGDHVNECFGLRKWALVNQLDFSIYNRWGQLVFHSTDPSACWDGTFRGQPQPSGGFVYIIRAKSLCGEVFRRGTVLLIR